MPLFLHSSGLQQWVPLRETKCPKAEILAHQIPQISFSNADCWVLPPDLPIQLVWSLRICIPNQLQVMLLLLFQGPHFGQHCFMGSCCGFLLLEGLTCSKLLDVAGVRGRVSCPCCLQLCIHSRETKDTLSIA